MSCFAPNIATAIRTWLMVILLSSFIFHLIGFNAAHHHPDIFHDGDIYRWLLIFLQQPFPEKMYSEFEIFSIFREDLDWGLLQLDAVRGRKVIDDSLFLALTNFGSHTLHHLLPTVDHAYLPLCIDAYRETCQEFNLKDENRMTQWEHVKGQFQQIIRVEAKYNAR